jgi:hypothetical protein
LRAWENSRGQADRVGRAQLLERRKDRFSPMAGFLNGLDREKKLQSETLLRV